MSLRCLARLPRKTLREPSLRLHGISSTAWQPTDLASYELSPAIPPPSTGDDHANERITELTLLLRSDRAPRADIWGCYRDTIAFLGHRHKMSSEIHKNVLRAVSPMIQQTRWRQYKHRGPRQAPDFHPHEEKFQDIIHNMRTSGSAPDLEDYHFIIGQFAAAGCFPQALEVLQEIVDVGLVPTQVSYALCLQAISHRLAIPPQEELEVRQAKARSACLHVMQMMNEREVPFTKVIVDFTVGILREGMDLEAIEDIIRRAYGVDLNFPDRPLPIQYAKDGTPIDPPPVVPMGSLALYNILDTLGRLGETSKMIQTFEVLTQPLPFQASQHLAASFDEEDDFGAGVPSATQEFSQLPHVRPNTKIYNVLISRLCDLKKEDIAKHYVLELAQLEREANEPVLQALHWVDPSTRTIDPSVPSPRFALGRSTLRPLLSRTLNANDIEGLAFITHITRQAAMFKSFMLSRISNHIVDGLLVLPSQIRRTPYFYGYNPNENSSNTVHYDVDKTTPRRPPPQPMDVNLLEAAQPSSARPIALDTHVKTVVRDLAQLFHFHDLAESIYQRSRRNHKEAIGRRVWKGKDVYFGTEKARVVVSQEFWAQNVSFPEPHVRGTLGARVDSYLLPADGIGGTGRMFGIEPYETPLERERRDPLRFTPTLYEMSLEEHLARRRGFAPEPADEEEGTQEHENLVSQ